MSDFILVTEDLTKTYGKATVVKSVNLHIKKGAIYGLIGKNGAGKTTIMKMLSGMASPTSGKVDYVGMEGSEKEIYGRIGALIEAPAIQPNFSAYDNLKMKCLAYGIGDKAYIEEKLRLVGLANVGKKKAGKFSLGMKQRLGIALALVGEPDFLILDEPINGLDPQGIVEVRELITKISSEQGITVMISSHILEELAKFATDYAIINNGVILEESTSEELASKCRDKILIKANDTASILPILDENGFTNYTVVNSNTIHVFDRLDEVSLLNMEIAKAGIMVDSIGIESSDLEEYFLKVTGTVAGEIR